MHLGELLCQIDEQRVSLRCSVTEDRLYYAPPDALPPNLLEALKQHKLEVIQILREDEEYHRTGIIQCKRQVFDLARDYLGEDGKA